MNVRSCEAVGKTALAVLVAAATACGGPDETVPRRSEVPLPEVPDNLVDLTHAFGAETIYWPTDTRGFELEVLAAGVTDGGLLLCRQPLRDSRARRHSPRCSDPLL